jgi:hypothetical protein
LGLFNVGPNKAFDSALHTQVAFPRHSVKLSDYTGWLAENEVEKRCHKLDLPGSVFSFDRASDSLGVSSVSTAALRYSLLIKFLRITIFVWL